MQSLILVLHIFVAIAIIALVLLQQGRGSDMGAAFGSSSSNTMFGSVGALPFLMKVTAICAAIFFLTSIALSNLAAHRVHAQSQMMQIPVVPATTTAPAKTDNKNNSDAEMGISFAPTVKK